MMKLILVGTRSGKPVIHWPGVLAASSVVVLTTALGAVVACFLLGHSFFLLPQTLLISIPMVLGAVVGCGVKRSFQMPPDQLPPVG